MQRKKPRIESTEIQQVCCLFDYKVDSTVLIRIKSQSGRVESRCFAIVDDQILELLVRIAEDWIPTDIFSLSY